MDTQDPYLPADLVVPLHCSKSAPVQAYLLHPLLLHVLYCLLLLEAQDPGGSNILLPVLEGSG